MNPIIIIGIVLLLIIVLVIYIITLYNNLAKLEINIKKEYSNIDVNLNKRSDLIPTLIEVIKKYISHEENLLTDIVKARNEVIESKNNDNLSKADQHLSQKIKSLFVIVENYPDLKSSENFLQLQQELFHIEDELSHSRIIYNDAVKKYNEKYLVIPANLFAKLLGFKEYRFFEVTEEEKEVPEINFDK